MHRYSEISDSVHILSLVCMFTGLTIWHWITHWCALPGEDYPFHAQSYIFACSSLYRAKTLWTFPMQFGMVIGVVFVKFTSERLSSYFLDVDETWCVYLLRLWTETILQESSWSLAHTVFLSPLLQCCYCRLFIIAFK